MVLSTPSSDAQPGPGPVAPWIERVAKLLRLVERGIVLLVDRANDARLGPLVRALCAEHPDLRVVTEAPRIEEAPSGSVIVLATRPEDADWLNLARPIFAERSLRLVLWSKAGVTAELARRAPDFFDWIARRFECPAGPPAFAVAGLRAALRARAWAVAFRGRGLEEVFAAALPRRRLVSANTALADEALLTVARGAGRAWIAWSYVIDERGARRVRRIAAAAGRRGRSILVNHPGFAEDAWPVSDATEDLAEAARMLESAGASSPARLAALLDLEPEAIALAAERIRGGLAVSEIEKAVLSAADPGAAMGRISGEDDAFDPVLYAARRVPPPLLRAFAADPRVRKAREVLAGSTRPALPPLTEKIAMDAAGAAEFKGLMKQLLIIHAGQWRLGFFPSSQQGREDSGVDAIAPLGLPGMVGAVAFTFKWRGIAFSDIAAALSSTSCDEKLTHCVVMTPLDSSPSDMEALRRLRKESVLEVHHWGQTWINRLLLKCPALLARYYPQEARDYLPGYDGTDFGTLAARYREKTALYFNRLKTIGIPPEARPRESRIELPLAELFIPLRLVPEESSTGPLDLSRALEAGRSAVVLADPGMGKSTLLAYLSLVFAGSAPLEGFAPAPRLIPFHISLREFIRRQRERPGLSFLDYLEIEARERLGLPEMHRAFFEATLRMGEAVVLLDGLDEVGNETARHTVATSIRALRADYPDSRFWVTSRVYGYTENVRLPGSFVHYRIGRLEESQIDNFIDRWYAHQITSSPQDAAEQAVSLRDAVRRTSSVGRLASNPLLLTLMAFIHQGLRRLPKDRGELYEKCIEMLLKTWVHAKRGDEGSALGLEGLSLNVSTQKDYLAHLAFFVQQKGHGGAGEDARGLVFRREALDALSARHQARARRERPAMTELEARDEMARFLEYVCDKTGLLLDRGDEQLSFIHLSFQEYLAAWVFLCDEEMPHGPGFFLEHLGDPAWEEVLLLRLYIVLRDGGGVKRFDEILTSVLRSLERKSMPEGWLTLARAIRDDLEFSDRDRKEILGRVLGFWLEAPAFEGKWFDALEEVKLLAESARGMLRDVLAQARAHARKPADAIALLYLETELSGFPEDAADVLRRRADLGELLADLVPLAEEPAIRALLAEKAVLADWIRALRALDGPEMYRLTVRWMTASPAPEAAEAAAALLWDKTLTDLRSRAAFAAPRRGHPDAVLFDRPGALALRTPFSSVTLPYACLRSVRTSLPPAISVPARSLLRAPQVRTWVEQRAADGVDVELMAWTASKIASWLDGFPAVGTLLRDAAPRLAAHFVHSFVRAFFLDIVRLVDDRGSVRDFGGDLGGGFGPAFGRAFVRESSRSFVRFFGHDFGRTIGRTLSRTLVRDFGSGIMGDIDRIFGHDIVRDVLGDFGVDPANPGWEDAWRRALEDEANQIRLLGRSHFWNIAAMALGDGSLEPRGTASTLDVELENPLALPLLLADIWSAASTHMLFASLRHAIVAHPGEEMPNGELEAWLVHNPIEVYSTAFAWQEHCKPVTKLEGPAGALLLAHAAYASLMTGLECKLPTVPDLADPRVRFSHLLYELCNFRDPEANARKLQDAIATPAPELRPLLEAAGLLVASPDAANPGPNSTRIEPADRPAPAPEPPLFTWLHLSDIHFGHGDASRQWDQRLVLDALRRDVADYRAHGAPRPDALFITGDIAQSGAPNQYAKARAWLDPLASSLSLPPDRVFLVPGNHDVVRSAGIKDRGLNRLLRGLRDRDESLDEDLGHPSDRALLTSRLAPYLSFASAYPSVRSPDPLFWSHAFTMPDGLPVRLIGLSTPLLADSDVDRGKLRLGTAPLAATLTDVDKSRELVLVLTHHPLRGGWLADQRDADRWLQSRAHVHLFGHVHEAESEDARSGAGVGLIRIAAGAAHGDLLPPGVPASHGYSIGAVVATGGGLRLRVWPRRWSAQSKNFRVDVGNVPEGGSYAEHTLPNIRLPARAGGPP